MDYEEIPCMQFQQSSAHNHGRYNKSTHEGRAVIGTSPALIHHQQLSINGLSSPTKGQIWIISLNQHQGQYSDNPCIPCKLANYSGFSSSQYFFPIWVST